jgi:SNF2 family DNA or RNA helicase
MEITRDFLIDLGGYDILKQARSMIERGTALNSNWDPPVLKGLVQEGPIAYRAGLVIKSARDVENLCSCRQSRERGIFCAHSVAVALHYLESQKPPESVQKAPSGAADKDPAKAQSTPLPVPSRRLQRAQEGSVADLAEIFVIVPPNIDQSISKGKITLYFEGKRKNGRSPLNSLPLNVPFLFSKEDSILLNTIESLGDGNTPMMLVLNPRQFSTLLPALVDHPRVTLGKTQKITIKAEPWRFSLSALLQPSGEIVIQRAGKTADFQLIEGEKPWVFHKETFQPLGLPVAFSGLLRAPMKLLRQQVPIFLSQQWAALEKDCDIQSNFKLKDFSFEPLVPKFILELKGGLARLEATLHCSYGNLSLTLGAEEHRAIWIADPSSTTRYSTRDLVAENSALERLLKCGFGRLNSGGRFQLSGQNQVLLFFARDYQGLLKTWKVSLEERLDRSMKENLEVIEPQFAVTSSGEQWFDLDVSFQAKGGESFSPSDIQQLLLKGQNYTKLKNGRLGIFNSDSVQELQEAFVDSAPQQHEKGYRLNSAQIGFLDATIQQQQWKAPASPAWRERAAVQKGEAKFEIPPLGELDAILRPYQKTGVGWLNFLRENNFGGILADEMGLGKTIQILAFLNSLKATSKLQKPSLIICPTTLVFNWAAEAQKFTPDLKILILHGPQRHESFQKASGMNLVITSYGLVRRDIEFYRTMEWDSVVLDEAQHIKNRQTQNAQAVKAVRSDHRLVLTGTPMENSVLDLWSIFDFLMPGYLGSASDFKERYELPIARDKETKAQARLGRRLRPFLLRRLKRDVAKDLPAKIEQISFCELSDDQRAIYRQVLEESRREVVEAVGANGLQKSRLMILTALLRLRQISCDLRLLKMENAKVSDMPSGKLEMFTELLDEVIDGGHRVLVFSQFVSMLTILRDRLTEMGIEFCYLDGSTTDRAEVVQRFQSYAEIPIFLISLKAGGVGLNLTGADTVIHFDPWWNPAIEDQATDRAHRIGQTKVVTSYKLIARGTVEEKILNLQTRKKGMIQSILGGEEQLLEALNWEDIQDLFATD